MHFFTGDILLEREKAQVEGITLMIINVPAISYISDILTCQKVELITTMRTLNGMETLFVLLLTPVPFLL